MLLSGGSCASFYEQKAGGTALPTPGDFFSLPLPLSYHYYRLCQPCQPAGSLLLPPPPLPFSTGGSLSLPAHLVSLSLSPSWRIFFTYVLPCFTLCPTHTFALCPAAAARLLPSCMPPLLPVVPIRSPFYYYIMYYYLFILTTTTTTTMEKRRRKEEGRKKEKEEGRKENGE